MTETLKWVTPLPGLVQNQSGGQSVALGSVLGGHSVALGSLLGGHSVALGSVLGGLLSSDLGARPGDHSPLINNSKSRLAEEFEVMVNGRCPRTAVHS